MTENVERRQVNCITIFIALEILSYHSPASLMNALVKEKKGVLYKRNFFKEHVTNFHDLPHTCFIFMNPFH